jgi:hypothetical protein
MGATDAYYDVVQPNRCRTIISTNYYNAIRPNVLGLTGPFSLIEVQGVTFVPYSTLTAGFDAWMPEGMDFLHIHRAEGSKFRVYIPADMRHISDIISVLWDTPSLTGFKVAGYDDANNRSDVMIGWVVFRKDVESIARRIPSGWLHGMRPPGSTIISMGCLIGYSEEVSGSSMGTEVVRDLRNR